MNPTEYEQHVAAVLRAEGWEADVTAAGGDGGVDILASRDGVRLGVQVKRYGGSTRPVNSQIVRELFGAATCEDCTSFMIATDGRVLPDAQVTADKLGVLIRHIDPSPHSQSPEPLSSATGLTFESVWRDQMAPLEGRKLLRANGSANEILAVDGGGVLRRTSGGDKQRLDIEIFRWTIERLLRGDVVTRAEIDERWIKRGSSGVVLILSHLAPFERTKRDGKLALQLATQGTAA